MWQWLGILLVVCCTVCAGELQTVTIGPRTVAPGEMDMLNTDVPPAWLTELTSPTAMHSFVVHLLSPSGETLNQTQIYLHHIFIDSPAVVSVVCPEWEGYNFVAATGAEKTDIILPYPYALKLTPENADWRTNVHVINPQDVELEYIIQYEVELSDWTEDLVEVEGYFNSVTTCSGVASQEFDVPKLVDQPSFSLSVDFPSTITGELVWMAGHQHRGGLGCFISRPVTGEVLYSSTVRYQFPGHPDYVSSIDHSTDPVRMEMLEPLRLTCVYDCSEEYPENMGIILAYAAVEERYSGNPPLLQTSDTRNVFQNEERVQPVGSSASTVVVESPLTGSAESPVGSPGSSAEDEGNKKQPRAVLGLAGSFGMLLMILVCIGMVAAVVVLVRLRSKRQVEIFDETEA